MFAEIGFVSFRNPKLRFPEETEMLYIFLRFKDVVKRFRTKRRFRKVDFVHASLAQKQYKVFGGTVFKKRV